MSKQWMQTNLFIIGIIFLGLSTEAQIQFSDSDGSLSIEVNQQPFATYVYQDKQIPRPYFHSVYSPKGIQGTRNHPPVKGQDPTDHATYHPGIWLSFGDISGHDFWRNQATTQHVKFLEDPKTSETGGTFTTLNRYTSDEQTICEEQCTINIIPQETGVMMVWKSVFSSNEDDFVFGDQEEMGLGVRVASPFMVDNGGVILNSHGARNEEEVWGKQAEWCAYYGKGPNDEHAGMVLMPSPNNFRPSWFHARDYGLLTANPFGRNAFTSGEKSQIFVKQGESFELHFGIFVFQTEKLSTEYMQSVYQEFILITQ